MAERTGIEWCDHTFNPWTGCQKVSPACDHCYAEAQAKRNPSTFGGWGPHAPRKRTSESYWRQPLLWNKRAAKEGRRARVFCASMADVFDNQVPEEWRVDLWHLIRATPALDWLLLTKRPQNIRKMLPEGWGDGWPNVWLGATVEDQEAAMNRIPVLLDVKARRHFLSCEPLLGAVDLRAIEINGGYQEMDAFLAPTWRDLAEGYDPNSEDQRDAFQEEFGLRLDDALQRLDEATHATIDWVIAGGESGPHARPSHPDWFRSLRDQCSAAGVPFFFKQWGEWLPGAQYEDHHRVTDSDDAWSRHRTMDWDSDHGGWVDASGEWGADLTGDEVHRVGKKAAGALLDGREHREWPA